MAAPAVYRAGACVRREPPARYMAAERELDAEHLEAFAKAANALAVAEDTEFLFHTEVVAQRSKVLAVMLADARAGQLSGGAGLLRFEAPFAMTGTDAMRSFLRLAYQSASAAEVVREVLAAGRPGAMEQLARLADQLEARGILAAVDAALAAEVASRPAGDVAAWLPLLALTADSPAQLPAAYQAAVDVAVRAVTASCAGEPKEGLPLQRFASSEAFAALPQATLGSIMAAVVSTVRATTSTALLATATPRPARTQCGPFSGTFTWAWRPEFGLEDARAQQQALSPPFCVGGVTWTLAAYLNGDRAEARGHLSLYLDAETKGSVVPARRARFVMSVASGRGAAHDVRRGGDAHDWIARTGTGFYKLVSHTELLERDLMPDGVLTLRVELIELMVYDC
eukprot:scaffold12.g7917.t1